jgi:hypothetical protein
MSTATQSGEYLQRVFEMISFTKLLAVLILAVSLTACSVAPSATPEHSPTAAPPSRAPITRTSPLLEVMPLAAGTSWAYTMGRSDLCLSKSTNLVVDGMITETVTSAWQHGDALVFEVRSDADVFDVKLQKTNYYVLLDDRLYYVLKSPARVLDSQGVGCDDVQVLKWPLQVGDTFGYWTVAAEEVPLVDAELPEKCYRLEKRTSTSAHDAWFCPGMGFVQYRDQGFVAPVSDETRQLAAFAKP